LLLDAGEALTQAYLETASIDGASAMVEALRQAAATQHDFMRLGARPALARGKRDKARRIVIALRQLPVKPGV
jgi:hypothetical protein